MITEAVALIASESRRSSTGFTRREELLVVVVVVGLLAGDGLLVGLQDAVDELIALEQDVERGRRAGS